MFTRTLNQNTTTFPTARSTLEGSFRRNAILKMYKKGGRVRLCQKMRTVVLASKFRRNAAHIANRAIDLAPSTERHQFACKVIFSLREENALRRASVTMNFQ